jgi:hypothetical protein
MKPFERLIACLGLICAILALSWCAQAHPPAGEHTPTDLPILAQWRGDYPMVQLDQLPEGQATGQAGYLGTLAQFLLVWSAFKPAGEVPHVDFHANLVLFTRNIDFYNRTRIMKVTLNHGVADIIAMETRSAQPIEDKVPWRWRSSPVPGSKPSVRDMNRLR